MRQDHLYRDYCIHAVSRKLFGRKPIGYFLTRRYVNSSFSQRWG